MGELHGVPESPSVSSNGHSEVDRADLLARIATLEAERDNAQRLLRDGWIAGRDGDLRVSPVMLERSMGANFLWLVWAVKPGAVRLIAICSDEAKADRYADNLPPGLDGFRSWKERAPIDHAFGFADSMHARAQGRI